MATNAYLLQATSPRNVTVLLFSLWIALLAYNSLTQLSGILTIHDFEPYFLRGLEYLSLWVWLPWVIVAPIVVAFARRHPIHLQYWVRSLILHAVVFVSLSLLIGLVIGFHYYFFGDVTEDMQTYQAWQHTGHFLIGDRLLLYYAIIFTVMIATFNVRNLYENVIQRERDSLRLTSQLKEAQLHALKMQVNPHFLFNTLNSITTLIQKGDNAKAKAMVQNLSQFFRSNLDDAGEQLTSLEKELELAERYLAIEKIRFSDRLAIKHQLDKISLRAQVPTMILQPLVENAVRHGIGNSDTPCVLSIESHINAQGLNIAVKDNGAGCDFGDDSNFSEGVGLNNVRERLRQNYGDEFTFEYKGRRGEGTTVTMTIPLIFADQNNIKDSA